MVKMPKNRIERYLKNRKEFLNQPAHETDTDGLQGECVPADFRRFCMRFIRAVKEATEAHDWHFEPIGFKLVSASGNVIELAEIYWDYCRVPPSHQELFLATAVRVMVRGRQSLPSCLNEVPPQLFPTLETRLNSEGLRLTAKIEGTEQRDLPQKLFTEHLVIKLGYELADAVQGIRGEDLDRWQVGFDDVLEVATKNLRTRPYRFIKDGDGVFISTPADSYASACLLLTDVIQRLPVKGDHIAFVPDQSRFVVTGSEDEEGLLSAVTDAVPRPALPRPLGGFFYRLGETGWSPWLPPVGHPAFDPIKLAHDQTLVFVYEELNPLLDRLFTTRGPRRWVSRLSVRYDSHGHPVSNTAIASGNDTILPKADEIGFLQIDEATRVTEVLALNNWQRVQEIAGELFEPLDDYPPRYRVRSFPSAAQLKAIGVEVD